MSFKVIRISSFSENGRGGNPAGVVIADKLPSEIEMRDIAAEVGFSETAFACPEGAGWRVRYFSPETEVPFCGHATIALGAALAMKRGSGIFDLILNEARITVEGQSVDGQLSAALQSPPTNVKIPSTDLVDEALALFGYTVDQLDSRLPPMHVNAGADHMAITLKSREALTNMNYDLDEGRKLMLRHGWVTIMLAQAESSQLFHSRNPFASGGIYEDPATGAATAAFAGYLRQANWPHSGQVDFIQGEDMGMRSRLRAEFSSISGSSIRVSGDAVLMD